MKLLLSGTMFLAVTAASLPFAAAQRANVSADSATIAEQYLLSAANQERAQRGLPPLHRDPELAHAAAAHAREMAAHGTISHQFAGEPELTERGSSAGVAFSTIAENVAEAPSAVQIHDMWMHSDHHRANLLNPSVNVAGISVVSRGNELFAVEDFAKTVRSVSLRDQEEAIASLVTRGSQIRLATNADAVSIARETCAMSTGYAGARKPWFVMRFTSDSLNRLPDELKARLATGRYREAVVGACASTEASPFTSYNLAVMLYP